MPVKPPLHFFTDFRQLKESVVSDRFHNSRLLKGLYQTINFSSASSNDEIRWAIYNVLLSANIIAYQWYLKQFNQEEEEWQKLLLVLEKLLSVLLQTLQLWQKMKFLRYLSTISGAYYVSKQNFHLDKRSVFNLKE